MAVRTRLVPSLLILLANTRPWSRRTGCVTEGVARGSGIGGSDAGPGGERRDVSRRRASHWQPPDRCSKSLQVLHRSARRAWRIMCRNVTSGSGTESGRSRSARARPPRAPLQSSASHRVDRPRRWSRSARSMTSEVARLTLKRHSSWHIYGWFARRARRCRR